MREPCLTESVAHQPVLGISLFLKHFSLLELRVERPMMTEGWSTHEAERESMVLAREPCEVEPESIADDYSEQLLVGAVGSLYKRQ